MLIQSFVKFVKLRSKVRQEPTNLNYRFLLNDCEEVPQEIRDQVKEMSAAFSSPWSLVYHIGKNLVVNGVDILKNIEQAITFYKDGKYYEFGETVGKALAEVVLKCPVEMKIKAQYDT